MGKKKGIQPKRYRTKGLREEDLDIYRWEYGVLPNGWLYDEKPDGEQKPTKLFVRSMHHYTLINLLKTSILQQQYERARHILEVLSESGAVSIMPFWQVGRGYVWRNRYFFQ